MNFLVFTKEVYNPRRPGRFVHRMGATPNLASPMRFPT